jgi:hypothetical protein
VSRAYVLVHAVGLGIPGSSFQYRAERAGIGVLIVLLVPSAGILRCVAFKILDQKTS